MFRHVEVGLRRHLWALLAAALATGAANGTLVTVLGVPIVIGQGTLSPLVEIVAISAVFFLVTIVVTLTMLPIIAVPISIARWALGKARRNVGIAYLLLASIIGLITGLVTGMLSTKPLFVELVCGTAVGAVSGIVYWGVARRGSEKRGCEAAVFA